MSGGAMQPCPEDHPLMIAWKAYQKTEDYQNSYNWATRGIDYMVLPKPVDITANPFTHDHYRQFVQGSLWAAFMAGFNASPLRDALERIALLDEADGHELKASHALQAVSIATSTLGKHPSVIAAERATR